MGDSQSKPKWPAWFLLWSFLLAGLALFFSSKPNQHLKPSLTLPDGSKISVAAVTYGTNHAVGGWLARLIRRSPAGTRSFLGNVLGQFAGPAQTIITPTPTLIVWMNATAFYSFTSISCEVGFGDKDGFVSGSRAFLSPNAVALGWPLPFGAFPRRDRTLALHVFQHDQKGNLKECGGVEFANPVYRNYPQWQPEALPVTRQAGDVEATLLDFSTGYGNGTSVSYGPDKHFTIALKPRTNDGQFISACTLHLRSLTDSNQIWEVGKVELSDATGNVIRATGFARYGSAHDFFSFEPGLWPEESAWKLRCQLICVKGFLETDLIRMRNIPLGELFQTNHPDWETNVNGTTIRFHELARRPPSTNDSWNSAQLTTAAFKFDGMTDDLHFELVEARADDGTKLENVSTSSTSNGNGIDIRKDYSFRNLPSDAKFLSLTFVLRKGRWVEFLVKPGLGSGHFEFPAQPE